MRATYSQAGQFRFKGEVFRAACGRGGVSTHKQESDGATPAGVLPLRRLYYRADRVGKPRTVVPIEPLALSDGWCDDPASSAYNKAVGLPFAAHYETLWRADFVYDVIGVLGWNDVPVMPGRGSAIFLHVARPDYAPTEGCLALALFDLLRVLAAGLTEIEVT